MSLKTIGFLFILVGISSLLIHFILEGCSILTIKKWLKKNKNILLIDADIKDKYINEVINSQEYSELKEIHDNAPFIFKKASIIGLNYLDFYFFQNLIGNYYSKGDNSLIELDNFNRLRKILWIILTFRISLFLKDIGLFFSKFSIVYFTVLFFYDKVF